MSTDFRPLSAVKYIKYKEKNMFCEKCGNALSDTAKFCGKCGHKVKEKKSVCPDCGTEYELGQIYCEQCGGRLSDPSDTQPSNGATHKESNPSFDLSSFKISGDKIGDITRLRNEAGGMGLKEAKEIIDELYLKQSGNNPAPPRPAPEPPKPTPVDTNVCLAQSPTVSYYKGNKSLGTSSTNGILKLYADRIEFMTTFGAGQLFGGAKPPQTMYFSNLSSVDRGRYMMGASILITEKSGAQHTFAGLSSNLYAFLDKVHEQMK